MSEQTKFYKSGAIFWIASASGIFLKEIWVKPKEREPIKAVEYEELPTRHRRLVDSMCEDKELISWLLGYYLGVLSEKELEEHFH